jgi:cellobiose-specific phosphotransferase system component IIA
MEFKNLQLLSKSEKYEHSTELLERANELLDEAFEAHLKFVSERASKSGRKIKEAFGNE